MLNQIADHLEHMCAMSRKIKQALFYPAVIATVGLLITLCMLIFIIPHFQELFKDSKHSLPFITQFIFFLSDALRIGLIPLLFLVSIIIGYLHWRQPISLATLIMKVMTKTPVLKQIWQQIVLLRFCRNLAITLTAGIAITKALTLAAQTCGDIEFEGLILKTSLKVQSGLSLHKALQFSGYLTPLLLGLIKTGEQTGNLEAMLTKAASFIESDLKSIFERLSLLLEPLIMMILGVLIGGLVIGMYLPIFNLGKTI